MPSGELPRLPHVSKMNMLTAEKSIRPRAIDIGITLLSIAIHVIVSPYHCVERGGGAEERKSGAS